MGNRIHCFQICCYLVKCINYIIFICSLVLLFNSSKFIASEHLRSTKRKKGSKKGRLKKRKESAVEPNASSTEICAMLGLTDVPNNFTEEDINSITSAKVIYSRLPGNKFFFNKLMIFVIVLSTVEILPIIYI